MKNQTFSKLVVIFFFIYSAPGYSQIPNSSFENWDTSQNDLKPVGWLKYGHDLKITRDTISIDGKYSLLISHDNSQNPNSCYVLMEVTLDSIENIDSTKTLSLHAIMKTLPSSNGAYLLVELLYYNNKSFASKDYTYYSKESHEWRNFLLPFKSIEKDSIVLRILGGGAQYDGDGCGLKSNIWIDNIKVIDKSTTNSVDITQKSKTMHLSPNPVLDILTIDSPVDWHFISIFDVSGRMITGSIPFNNNLDVSHLEPGTYILHTRDKITTANKIFVKM